MMQQKIQKWLFTLRIQHTGSTSHFLNLLLVLSMAGIMGFQLQFVQLKATYSDRAMLLKCKAAAVSISSAGRI